MENAASALKMVFSIFVVIMAFSITLSMLSLVKETADVVAHYSDQTNWYLYQNAPTDDITVNKDVIISSLYSIYDENIDITISIDSDDYRFTSDSYYKNNNKEKTFNIKNELNEKLSEFITSGLLSGTFTMTCKEIKTSGLYEYGNDGTEIVKAQGGTKLYITYTKV